MDTRADSIDPEGLFGFWKNIALIIVFFTLTPVALGTSLFSLFALNRTETVQSEIVQKTTNIIEYPRSGVRVYASLPGETPSVSSEVSSADARPEIVRQYLERYDSPLAPLSNFIVQTADKHGIDYRLITAIAQQESNLCKKIPYNSYNCWGWGIHSKGSLGFSSFEEGIETVTQGLKENYIDKGYVTPEEIMKKYTPPSRGSWAVGVTAFMGEMQ